MKSVPIVFLTESGHSPNSETMEYYLSQFSRDYGNRTKLTGLGGPSWARPLAVVQKLREDDNATVAVFTNNCQCDLGGKEFVELFIRRACENPLGHSWQIAMEVIRALKLTEGCT